MRSKIEILDNLMWLKEQYLVVDDMKKKEISIAVDILEWILKGKSVDK